jgi:hypothetical protein
MFSKIPKLEHRKIDLRSIKLDLLPYEKGVPRTVSTLSVDDTPCEYTPRFEKSLCHLFRQKESIFTLFDPVEVIERSLERMQNPEKAKITFCITQDDQGKEVHNALAVIPPHQAIIDLGRFTEILESEQIKDEFVRYDDGTISSFHEPVAKNPFLINGDNFIPGFNLFVPIDGYGSTNSYLSMLREVCSNGSIALAPTFRTQIKMGKHSPDKVLARFLQTFNNEEGFAAIKERLETASNSWASLREYGKLRSNLMSYSIDSNKMDWEKVTKDLDTRAGDILSRYSIAGTHQLPPKVQQRIPTEISVYDLFNFATEVSTHYSTEKGYKKINAFAGTLLAEEGGYDLEGSKLEGETPEALFLEASKN